MTADQRASYAEILARVDELAGSLVDRGIARGDRVGIAMLNGVEAVVALLATATLGAVAVPLNLRFKPAELRDILDEAELALILTAQDRSDVEDRVAWIRRAVAADAGPPVLRVDDAGGKGTARSPAVLEGRRASVRARDPGCVIFTSGTTSRPKGVVLSHEAVLRAAFEFGRRFDLGPDDRVWDAKPLYHVGGLQSLFGSLAAGAAYCTLPHFDPEAALAQLVAERCTVAYPVYQALWSRIVEHPAFEPSDLAALRAIAMVGPPALLRAFQGRTPDVPVCASYGSSECNPVAYSRPDESEEVRLDSVGRITAGVELRVVDPSTGAEVAAGDPGELVYRGPSSFDGYLGDDELTSQRVDAEGWYRSGDLGAVDGDGVVTFRGRLKDMLKVGGENVAAVEIEDCLLAHGAVAAAAVVAVPDDYYGEVPAAFVELRAGVTVSEDELIEHCLGTIARFKVPRYVRWVTDWPMSVTKVRKEVLRERLVAELSEAGVTRAPRPGKGQSPTAPA